MQYIFLKNRRGVLVLFIYILTQILGDFANICCVALDVMSALLLYFIKNEFCMALCFA